MKIKLLARISGRVRRSFLKLTTPRIVERYSNPYATHLPIIVGLSSMVEIRHVLELGCGEHSTLTFLNRKIFPNLVNLESFENDSKWAQKVVTLCKDDPRLNLRIIERSISDSLDHIDWGLYDLIFIDDSTTAKERASTITKVVENCSKHSYVLIHDYEVEDYQIAGRPMQSKFVFNAFNPNTGILRMSDLEKTKFRKLNDLLKKLAKEIPADDVERWKTELVHFD